MTFAVQRYGTLQALVYEPWIERGVVHGFTLAPADFGETARARWAHELSARFGGVDVSLLHQVHGCVAYEIPGGMASQTVGDLPHGDAFIWRRSNRYRGIFGVKGADCAQILVVSSASQIAIHAGWRGLERGIIAHVLKEAQLSDEPCECVIGPCAGPTGYEVGPEVIEALGAAAIVQRETGGRTYLDVARTAEVLVRQACPRANVYRADINTVTDERFHSYRRARDHAGRGLGFFLVDS